ncbi:NAD(P)-dependent alcohol dehydrogenase [Psychrobacillus soli]|nr:NAD(P)-dependent alcohol dehydrogenase [Psychrobacillus soli]
MNTLEMKVANLVEISKVEVGYEEIPSISPNEVLIKINAVGVCGSDIHYYKHGHIGKRTVQYPHIQGHECAGTIVKIGSDVTKFSIGDRVAVEPGVPCRICEKCRSGKYNLCDKVIFLSTPPYKGALRQYISHPEDYVFLIPDSLTFEEATLAEPLSVGIHALNRANLKPGMKVLIMGMGPVGLMAVAATSYFNAEEIAVTDIVKHKLEVAKSLGATQTIEVAKQEIAEHYFDLVLETSGAEQALAAAINSLKKGGKLVSIGFPHQQNVTLDLTTMLQKEIDLLTVYRYANTFPLAINILTELKDVIGNIITSTYVLDDISDAMEKACETQLDTIKVIVYPHLPKDGHSL